jgi:hypothetical protein
MLRTLSLCVIASSAVLAAQDRRLGREVQGVLKPGVPEVYSFRAAAGDLVSGAFLMADAGKREDYPKRPVPTLDPSIVIVQQPAPEGTP